MDCDHSLNSPDWAYGENDDGEEVRWCYECGQLWFRRNEHQQWFQRYWTQQEIDKIHERTQLLSERIDGLSDDDVP